MVNESTRLALGHCRAGSRVVAILLGLFAFGGLTLAALALGLAQRGAVPDDRQRHKPEHLEIAIAPDATESRRTLMTNAATPSATNNQI